MLRFLLRTTLLPLLIVPLSQLVSAAPNIVFILADDMGYADIGCYGAPDAKTPHIDGLAAQGVSFSNIYAMGPECTPSRTAFLTGRYPQRAGGLECAIGTGNVGRYDEAIKLAETKDLGLPKKLAVLAPALKTAGYRNAVFGKWHLGYEDKFSPLEQGFDEFTGFLGGNVDYFHHVELSDLEVYLKGRKPIDREGYTTDLITKDAVDFLKRQQTERSAQPFFLYLPHAAPHFPFQAPNADPALPTTEEWTKGTRVNYVAMLGSLDDSVGAVLKALEDNGQADNTVVVFASDHGAMAPGLNTPWRDFKGTLFDGGIRVPLIVRWPGTIKPGQKSAQVGTLMDLTASFIRIAGATVADGQPLDGMDLIDHVERGAADKPRTLYWRSRRGDKTWWAIRDGDMKYVRKQVGEDIEQWLFDLKADPGEATDLFEKDKKAARPLRRKLRRWEKGLTVMR